MDIRYRFLLAAGEACGFELRLDPGSLALAAPVLQPAPDWARLGNHQCPRCPLDAAAHPLCPVARNLAGIIHDFARRLSFEEGDIVISTGRRECRRRASLQAGVSSLIGIVMVTSGCPILDQLRPMVYTHLPFASSEETAWRVISMYLTAQHFRRRQGLAPDWDLAGLVRIYADVGLVNRHFVDRLRTVPMEDASLNAVVKLDCFATLTTALIADRDLETFAALFQGWMGASPA